MTLTCTGVFIATGILAYVILWIYIFLQFFKLVKPFEGSKDSFHEADPNLCRDVLFSNCSESSDADRKESCQIVANISPPKESLVLNFELFSSDIGPDVIRSNSLLLLQFDKNIYPVSRVLDEVRHLDKILDVYKFLKFCLRRRIGPRGMSTVTRKDKSEKPKLRDMELADVEAKDSQKPGNRVFSDIRQSFGTFEVVKCHATPPDIKPDVQLGREEKDLNTMIRRLVGAELMKCCEKEHGAMSRAHSETNNRVNWKRNKYSKQAVSYHANPVPSFGESHQTPKESTCESGNPESVPTFSILTKNQDDLLNKRINGDLTPKFVTENVAVTDQSCNPNDEEEDDDKGCVESVRIVEEDVSISFRDGYRVRNPSVPENMASIEVRETETIRTAKTETMLQPDLTVGKSQDASTQTEHMYMIRAVRSCPGRRRRLQLIGSTRGMQSKAKNFPIDISVPEFLYRKASDNLIYEMSKGSRSPGYVPVPERFRWRYIMPTTIN